MSVRCPRACARAWGRARRSTRGESTAGPRAAASGDDEPQFVGVTYHGDLERGTRILYQRTKQIVVTPESYRELLAHFAGKDVAIGASRRPARGSLGSWLRAHLGVELAVVYVGPILVREGAAERVDETTLRFRA